MPDGFPGAAIRHVFVAAAVGAAAIVAAAVGAAASVAAAKPCVSDAVGADSNRLVAEREPAADRVTGGQ
jgi:hypothetical protein